MTTEQQHPGHLSGWSVEDDCSGGYRWVAHGPAGVLEGAAPTRAEAEAAALAAERELFDLRGPTLPKGGAEFDSFYAQTPPWEIGRPQPALLELADGFSGRVLDVGCGTGEHALLAASRGLEAVGIDAAPTAIRLAQEKAFERGLAATFVVADALDLPALFEVPFETVVDSALFHVFDDDERRRYVDALAAVTAHGGRYHLLCFSERAPGEGGPRRLSEGDIRASFINSWSVEVIEAVQMQTIGMAVPAWRAVITRS